ncbi:hypothetical protein JMJ35_009446 [Cladonia borealis]|uniref:BZIP domain-containing protein n=1 Tax=Cladonia borealis TaxID=184061 RepID=A0AA39UYC0_9LECA|nr:hypothetical protein JMJ35_009446 [Cladonia borealis]
MSQAPPPEEAAGSPPPGRLRREGNDSLWKRARRTLGTNSLTFLQPQSRPSGPTASGSGSGPAAPSKRREQVRHAQRTHRQRTQNYIKTLESEVVRLRESEMRLLEDKEKLQRQVDILKNNHIFSELPLPPGFESDTTPLAQPPQLSDFEMPATVSYAADDLNHQRLHVNFQRQDPSQGLGYPTQIYPMAASYQGHQDPQATPDLPNDFSLQALNVSSANEPRNVSSAYADPADVKSYQPVDTIEIAIDFVLALEHPCMPHIPYPANPPTEDPANHLMMASTPLVARAPDAPQLNQTWTASGAIIKELLNLSSSINLEGEITPVEAWHRLHQHPDFWRLNHKQIEALKRELSRTVRCCGFGAVLDESTFEDAVARTLGHNT